MIDTSAGGPIEDPSAWSLADLDKAPTQKARPVPEPAASPRPVATRPVPVPSASQPGAAASGFKPLPGAKPAQAARPFGMGARPSAVPGQPKAAARPALGFLGNKGAESPRPPRVEAKTTPSDVELATTIMATREPEPLAPAPAAAALSPAALSPAALSPAAPSPAHPIADEPTIADLSAPTNGEDEISEATITRPPSQDFIQLTKSDAPLPPASERPVDLQIPPPPALARDEPAPPLRREEPSHEPTHAEPERAEPRAGFVEPARQTAPLIDIPSSPLPDSMKAEEPRAAEPAVSSPKELPAFSSGATLDAPSKFVAATAVPRKKKGSNAFALTMFAAIVLVAGVLVYLYLRRQQGSLVEPSRPTPAAGRTSAPTATPTAAETASPTATANGDASAAPAAAAAGASAAPDGSAAAGGDNGPPNDPKSLAPSKGYLFVESPKTDASVFVFSTNVGPVNAWVEAPCKSQFVRPGKANPAGPAWVADGKTVDVACQGSTKVTIP